MWAPLICLNKTNSPTSCDVLEGQSQLTSSHRRKAPDLEKKKRLSQLFIPFMDSNYNLLHLCFVWPLGGGILMHSDLGGEPLLYVEGEPNSIWAPGGDILLHTGHRRRHPAAHRTGKRGPDACVHWEGAGHLFGPGHSVCPALVG